MLLTTLHSKSTVGTAWHMYWAFALSEVVFSFPFDSFKGAAGRSSYAAQAGDVCLSVKMPSSAGSPGPTFFREGPHLFTTLPLPLRTALCGGTVDAVLLTSKGPRKATLQVVPSPCLSAFASVLNSFVW